MSAGSKVAGAAQRASRRISRLDKPARNWSFARISCTVLARVG